MSNDEKERKEKVLQLLQDVILQDNALREKLQIGDKFRFVRDRLSALKLLVQDDLDSMQREIIKKTMQLTEDDIIVYVYIYNAQGIALQTWQKMLSPSVFYEYSVNRPVYTDKTLVESFVRSRPNKVQHGYLTIVIKKQDIIPLQESLQPKDPIGSPLAKIKEGSLHFNKMISFTYQNNEYVVSENGQLVKKEED